MVRLLVTGTPGVGKTTIATGLARIYGATIVGLDEIITPVLKWDPKLQTYHVTNENEARKLITERLKTLNSYIIDTVAVNLIDASLIDWCVVLRLEPTQLMDRLTRRNWPHCKVVENVLAEIVGSSLVMAINTFGRDRVIEVDTTNKNVDEVINYITNRIAYGRPAVGIVDWLDDVDTDILINLSKELDACLS
ncbi:kinase [Vulcanisaeta sp. EB80]|uniref:adenylate kinase family protein n=1 Tax=Vulcanisaeta sp. EB80 TaxID=1650660 RepID=UPI0009BC9E9B|nr:AAA family ATPase [Vulcanisaeta sp. EB80]MCG2865127.1 AAA family ATPase [Vulcanisaeta sp.]MCG2885490.1 AAA family ATPase [Vulcanisaeta sp.]PLC68496.1 kinase [Vulcanisaeta sp. EB80]